MRWVVSYHDDFYPELMRQSEAVQDEVLALAQLLAIRGPQLGRPHCDTLEGSRYPNMKELRFSLPDGVWRVAFAFDPTRQAILLVGASKSGVSQRRFYKDLIRTADARFAEHLTSLDSTKGI